MAMTPMGVYSGGDIVFENVKYPASGTITLNTNSANAIDYTSVIPTKTGYTFQFLIPLGVFQSSGFHSVGFFHNGSGKSIEYYTDTQISNCVTRAMAVYKKDA